jgi:lipoprotein-anchoring transpeptidase ErfK/SrfK
LRSSTSLTAIAFILGCSITGAAAQYYPPPPPDYIPPPPPYSYPDQDYAPAPPANVHAAPPYAPARVYRDANGAPIDPRYVQPGDDLDYGDPRAPQRSYSSQPLPPQPMPSLSGEPQLRPPGDIAGVPSTDVTGSVRNPVAPQGSVSAPPQDRATVIASLPPEDQPERGPAKELPQQFRRQMVDYVTKEPAGTIIIDTPNTYLYLVLGNGKAMRYGIGVGREGFTWTGTEKVSRMSEWPDWHPPKEMIERQPYLPRFMAGGDGNPLGARALYLGATLYRIHGTNQPSTIGTFVSSGCIRLTNGDISDLYSRVTVGTRVVVLPGSARATAATQTPVAR